MGAKATITTGEEGPHPLPRPFSRLKRQEKRGPSPHPSPVVINRRGSIFVIPPLRSGGGEVGAKAPIDLLSQCDYNDLSVFEK